MSVLQKWIFILALIGLAACAPVATPSPTTPTVTPASALPGDTVFIRYHRSGGIAGMDDTWLIYTSGLVEHSGRSSGHPLQLTASQLASLTAAAQSPEVAALKDSYVPADTCCDRFLHEITITTGAQLTLGGQTKTVRTLDGAPDEPPALTNLLNVLNTVLK